MPRSRLILWKLRDSYRSIPNGMFVLLVCAFVLVAYLLTSGEGAAAPASQKRHKATTTSVPDGATTSLPSIFTQDTIPPAGVAILPPLQMNEQSKGGTAVRHGGGGAVGVARPHATPTPRTTQRQRRTGTRRTRRSSSASTTPTTHR